MVTIVDPHIKVDADYFVYKEALDHGYLVMNARDRVFEGHCWPGRVWHFPYDMLVAHRVCVA